MPSLEIDPLIAVAVSAATALTDAIYVLFTNAVVKRRRLPALEQRLVHALLLRGHQLHQPLGLCVVCRGGIFHRRVCHHNLSAPRTELSPAARRLGAQLAKAQQARP